MGDYIPVNGFSNEELKVTICPVFYFGRPKFGAQTGFGRLFLRETLVTT